VGNAEQTAATLMSSGLLGKKGVCHMATTQTMPASIRYTIGDRLMRHGAYRRLVHLLDGRVTALSARLERAYEYDAILIAEEASR
jgi:hypothetical protein